MRKIFSPSRACLLGATAVAGSLLAPAAHAQTPDKKTAVGVNLSMMQYQGNLGGDFGKLHTPVQVGVGAHITRYLSPTFDLALLGNYQNYYRYVQDQAPYNSLTAKTGMFDLGLKLKLNNGKILKEDFFLQPYLMGGGGFFVSNVSGNYAYGNGDPYTPINGSYFNKVRSLEVFGAAGIRFRLSPALALDVQTAQHYPFTESFDNLGGPDNKLYDRFLVHSVGLTLALGKAKDTDGDGVPDRKDKCPDTPTGVKVDLVGCPVDTDGDGVADYQDKCPDVKGLANLQGCPDADGDGVADPDDKCPNTPAGVKVDASGCPLDTDGDGVSDDKDKCPDTPAGTKVDATGCPEKKAPSEQTQYINFDFNKSTPQASSTPKLEQMTQIMNEYPDYSLSIAGHADNKGSDEYNIRLSYERAESARKYLLDKGISADRIEARGYGEAKPIADNNTEEGRAQNRRVDFDPFLTGETNAAEAKYGPAPAKPAPKAVRKSTKKKTRTRKATSAKRK
jgi:OOP family OmpA-OmpF porin